jgi:hypothetical protein
MHEKVFLCCSNLKVKKKHNDLLLFDDKESKPVLEFMECSWKGEVDGQWQLWLEWRRYLYYKVATPCRRRNKRDIFATKPVSFRPDDYQNKIKGGLI